MYNNNKMKRVGQKTKPAFTIIETVMYIALTGVLFITAIATTRNVMTRQRYTDALQGLLSELRETYDEVTHPEIMRTGSYTCRGTFGSAREGFSPASGRPRSQSSCVIYGKVLSIYYDSSEKNSVIEKATVVGMDSSDPNVLQHVYSQHSITSLDNKTTLEVLQYLGADTMVDVGGGNYGTADAVETYRTHNKTALYLSEAMAYQSLASSLRAYWTVPSVYGMKSTPAKFMILIVRSPVTGEIETYTLNDFLGEYDATSDDYETLANKVVSAVEPWHWSLYARLTKDASSAVSSDSRFFYTLGSGSTPQPSEMYYGNYVDTGHVKYATVNSTGAFFCLQAMEGAHSSTQRSRMIVIKPNANGSDGITLLDVRDSAGHCER